MCDWPASRLGKEGECEDSQVVVSWLASLKPSSHLPPEQRQPGPLPHPGDQEGSLKVSKWCSGHEVAAAARGSMPLSCIRGLGRLESWFSFGSHHDTGPGRPDVPITETLLPCQPRYGMNETGIGDLEGFQMTRGLPEKKQRIDILHRPRNYTDTHSVSQGGHLTANKGTHSLGTRAPAIRVSEQRL